MRAFSVQASGGGDWLGLFAENFMHETAVRLHPHARNCRRPKILKRITFHRPHAPMFAALAFSATRTRGLLGGLRVRRPLRWRQPADICGMISLWAANRPSLRILDSRPALFLA